MEKPDIDLHGYIKKHKTETAIICASAIVWGSAFVSSRLVKQMAITAYASAFAGTQDAMEAFLDGAKAIKH